MTISNMELRWLKTILNDAEHKIKLFLSDGEIAMLNGLLNQCAPSVSPLPMDKIVFFDRFHFPEKQAKREAAVLATLVECIQAQRTVDIKYHTRKHQVKTGTYRPIVLEFSKRNNRFQGFLQECDSDRICTMNLSQIERAVETEASFDYAAAEQALAAYREDNTTSVQVAFYDTRNIVDRILTEFSPWEKRCSYDPETGLYQLTIFYQKQDEVDLVVRLMGYGGDLYFVDREHPICTEIQSRMTRQMDLIRERRSAYIDREPGDDL
ncbi:MAG: WYL domain-containing protein [Oscillospiraceae bacterium]|nr:WYL domain-containing protein [Oscillospiraceae bacterium]